MCKFHDLIHNPSQSREHVDIYFCKSTKEVNHGKQEWGMSKTIICLLFGSFIYLLYTFVVVTMYYGPIYVFWQMHYVWTRKS